MSEEPLSPPVSDRKFLCHLSGGGQNIIVTTVMMDFLKYLIGHGNLCDYFDYFSGVSSGAMAAASILLPKGLGAQDPLHSDFRWMRHNVLYANDDVFDAIIAKRFPRRQVVGRLVSSWPDSVRNFRVLSRVVRWLTDPNRLHFSPQKVANMIEKVIVGPEQGETNETVSLDFRTLGLDVLLKPFLCPSIHIGENAEDNEYYFHCNQSLPDCCDAGPLNERLTTALLATSRLVPLFPIEEDDPKIDGGNLFSGIRAAQLLMPDSFSKADITVFDCMDAPERVITRRDLHLQKHPGLSLMFAREAERRASRSFESRLFLCQNPSVSCQVFSRRIRQEGYTMPCDDPVVNFIDGFCLEYCGRSYQEVMNDTWGPIGLESVYTSDQKVHSQMVNQAIRSCVVRLADMMTLAERIIQGPLARRYGLLPQQQSELISDMRARAYPAVRPSYQHRGPNAPWPGFDDSSAVAPA